MLIVTASAAFAGPAACRDGAACAMEGLAKVVQPAGHEPTATDIGSENGCCGGGACCGQPPSGATQAAGTDAGSACMTSTADRPEATLSSAAPVLPDIALALPQDFAPQAAPVLEALDSALLPGHPPRDHVSRRESPRAPPFPV